MMKHINPWFGQRDRLYFWPITPFNETSYAGMKRLFVHLMESFQRGAKWVKALLDAWSRCTVSCDYLHEIRMHRQDIIYRSKYGGFLQCLQAELGQRRVSRLPAKRNMQAHEEFLLLVHRSLKRWRFDRFLDSTGAGDLQTIPEEDPLDALIRLDSLFATYCKDLEKSADEPTRMCALHIKEMESYLRSTSAVRNENAWLSEIEACKWLGGHKITKKSNYMTETCQRFEMTYGPDMDDVERERIRINQ